MLPVLNATNVVVSLINNALIPKYPPSRLIPVFNSSSSIIADIVIVRKNIAPDKPIPAIIKKIIPPIKSEIKRNGINTAAKVIIAQICPALTPYLTAILFQRTINAAAEIKTEANNILINLLSDIPKTIAP